MFCINCGKEIKEKDKLCPNCGKVAKESNQTNLDEGKAINHCYIALGLALAPIGIGGLLSKLLQKFDVVTAFFIYVILYVIGLVIVINSKVKNPNSKKINKLMIAYIIIGVLVIIGVALLIGLLKSCASCSNA